MANFWKTMATAAEQPNFKPFEDYLGLSNLVHNLASQSQACQAQPRRIGRSRSYSSSSSDGSSVPGMSAATSPGGNAGIWEDFQMNGVDVDDDGFAPFAPKQIGRNSRLPSMKNRRTPTWCVFCKNNGESEMVYGAHVLKDNEGRTTCPILRNYTCPICGISGDSAHTIKYCPLNKEEPFLPPSANILKKTARISTGKARDH